jgi:gamma-glutamyl-gamma-aminobutyrate hydrolase PuuD
VLAICRGVEVLNVVRGGDLVQHLPDVVGHEEHRSVVGEFSDHAVRVDPSSRIERVSGEGSVDLSVQEPPKLALVG